MIAHVVLFSPRADLPSEEADALVRAFAQAIEGIPEIQRTLVGRRVRIGRAYEQMMTVDFPYAAILEFTDVEALKGYLEHPAHTDVGARVFGAAGNILVYDFAMQTGVDGLSAAAAQP